MSVRSRGRAAWTRTQQPGFQFVPGKPNARVQIDQAYINPPQGRAIVLKGAAKRRTRR